MRIPIELHDKIIFMFLNEKNNKCSIIAKRFGIGSHSVNRIIEKYLSTKKNYRGDGHNLYVTKPQKEFINMIYKINKYKQL